jgi:hypothetical protein
MKMSLVQVLSLAGSALLGGGQLPATERPFITILDMPPYGNGGYLYGQASCNPSNPCVVAVYVKVNEKWWIKPYATPPVMPVGSDGGWGYHLSSYPRTDDYATKYVAFLVPLSASNSVPKLQGSPNLPAVLDEISLAKDVRIRTSLLFSGVEWETKVAVLEPWDPGPNRFATNSAWVEEGRLHLKIRKEAMGGTNQWSCAEVICGKELGYGLYRFYVDSPVGAFDPNIVFSPFSYSDYPDYNHREIDIEFTTWNGMVTNGNAQYAVQQATGGAVVERFRCRAEVTNSVHSFAWSPWRIDCRSLKGHDPASTNASDLIAGWSLTNVSQIPPAGPVRPRIALYLSNGQPPADTNEVEVLISRFEYQPLLRLEEMGLDAGREKLQFSTRQEVAGILDLESRPVSSGAGNGWEPLVTNIVGQAGKRMHFHIPMTNAQRYYRGNLRAP